MQRDHEARESLIVTGSLKHVLSLINPEVCVLCMGLGWLVQLGVIGAPVTGGAWIQGETVLVRAKSRCLAHPLSCVTFSLTILRSITVPHWTDHPVFRTCVLLILTDRPVVHHLVQGPGQHMIQFCMASLLATMVLDDVAMEMIRYE